MSRAEKGRTSVARGIVFGLCIAALAGLALLKSPSARTPSATSTVPVDLKASNKMRRVGNDVHVSVTVDNGRSKSPLDTVDVTLTLDGHVQTQRVGAMAPGEKKIVDLVFKNMVKEELGYRMQVEYTVPHGRGSSNESSFAVLRHNPT